MKPAISNPRVPPMPVTESDMTEIKFVATATALYDTQWTFSTDRAEYYVGGSMASVEIDAGTITFDPPGVGKTIICESHCGGAQYREITLVASGDRFVTVSFQPDQGEDDFAWTLAGILTAEAVAITTYSVRFAPTF